MSVTWLIHECDMSNSYVWHVSPGCTQMSWTSCCNTSRSPSASLRMDESCRTHEEVIIIIPQIWSSHATQMFMWECVCVMSHLWMSHVTLMNESCHTYEWVMSHIWMSHVTLMNESCHTYETVMQHKCFHLAPTVAVGAWMCVCHVTHMNESCHTYETVMQHKCFHLAPTMAFGACMCICKHTCIYKYSNKYLQICVFAKMFYQARFFYSIKYQRSSLALPHCGNLAYIRVSINIHIYK